MPSRPRPPSFADACARVVEAPDADHSLTTTLAPVRARMDVSEAASARTDVRRELLAARLPADVDRVAELGCGTGTLLDRLCEDYDAVGVDRSPELLAFAAARGAPVVRGDPANPPLRAAFDAVCAFDATGVSPPAPLSALFAGAYATLRPGGILVAGAFSDARAVAESGVETYRGARYVLERAVDVALGESAIRADYRVTDRRTGAVGVASERTPFRVVDASEVRAALDDAGFADASVTADVGVEGELVATAVRPVETEG
ncbi:methyltransferase domain-containing protein [Halogeometricum sp. S1BR25-6]|uniref:Methyltransferase domain-containing protein n=1 Tax=Halogeometricum salsisoli TaxID=2950536 RepID=A0ABU2GER6_9EURY|nr:methyltransferase domain-containing protein [Halogeometricum sp. S1BR25-6]MDS0299302.1 methyltransferase domain-containing protein [Halogeometricum sp. S1BR25-6]